MTLGVRKAAHNSTYPKGGVSCSKDSFVVGSSVVLRLNICAKNPPLRQAAKRYLQCQDDCTERQILTD